MHEGAVRRVHEADDGMVDRTGKAHRLDHAVAALTDIGNQRDVGRARRVAAEIDPDIALHLARRITGDAYPGGVEVLALDERRDGGGAPIGGQAPAMAAALDLAAAGSPPGQRATPTCC